MNFNSSWWLLCAFFSFAGLVAGVEREEVHLNVPRWLRLFSRGPSEEDAKYEGKDVLHHIDNVLNGGTVGVEVDAKKHLGKLVKLWSKLREGIQKLKMKAKKRSRPSLEDKEVEERHLPSEERIDPRKKWPPSKLQEDNDDDNNNDNDVMMVVKSRPRDELDPDSELVRTFGSRNKRISIRDKYRYDPDS